MPPRTRIRSPQLNELIRSESILFVSRPRSSYQSNQCHVTLRISTSVRTGQAGWCAEGGEALAGAVAAWRPLPGTASRPARAPARRPPAAAPSASARPCKAASVAAAAAQAAQMRMTRTRRMASTCTSSRPFMEPGAAAPPAPPRPTTASNFYPCSLNLRSHVRSCPLRVLALPAQALQPPQDVFTREAQ